MKLGGHIEIEGRIGSVPELVNEMCGHKLVRFVIAVTDKYIKNNKYSQHTRWYTVNALGDTAETILKSDMRICDTICISGQWLIDGNSEVTDNGNYSCEILAEDVASGSKALAKEFNVA
ncbi:MAG: single-stranded DNA-binding protein [Bacteroidales bacterium]|nr:single-stranded DNA-binding protein [Bacteroidales bacterium]